MKLTIAASLFASASAASLRANAAAGFCSYPMWTIPDVGTDYRCDFPSSGCPKRIDDVASPGCSDSYGVQGGESCSVRCASAHDGGDVVEQWTCDKRKPETWVLTSGSLTCPAVGDDLLVAQPPSPPAEDAAAGFCSYPMWTIPDVGTDYRCDFPSSGCPKRIDDVASPGCSDSYGVQGGESCSVRCASAHDGGDVVELWTCDKRKPETWVLTSGSLTCPAVGGRVEEE